MKCILISPFSHGGYINAKSYPYWNEVCDKLKGYELVQIGVLGEPELPGIQLHLRGSLKEVEDAIRKSDLVLCVDNFAHHCAWYLGKRAVVIWGPSDPEIFGHKEHINLLKSREYLRKDMFGFWRGYVWEHKEKGWVSPDEIVEASIKSL